MKKNLLVFLLLAIVFVPSMADTYVSGDIVADSTWSEALSPYVVTGDVTISSTAELTVEAGVTIKFHENKTLFVDGELVAAGTSSKRIVFTSFAESSYNWRNIYIRSSGVADLSYCDIKYGGYSENTNLFFASGSSSSSLFSNCRISNADYGIVLNDNSKLNLEDSQINGCQWPLVYNGDAELVFSGTNDLGGNAHNGILINFPETSGLFYLDKAPVPYVFTEQFKVNSSDSLKIAEGNILKFVKELFIYGVLQSRGTQSDKVYFTSFTDDNAGGNTDGLNVLPEKNDWRGIYFYGSSGGRSKLTYTIIKYAGYNTSESSYTGGSSYGSVNIFDGTDLVFDNCMITNSFWPVYYRGYGELRFENSNDLESENIFPGLFIYMTATDGDFTLFTAPKPYVFKQNFTVHSGDVLTVKEDNVLKFGNYRVLLVKGTLNSEADEGHSILYTSFEDDNGGGDTNNDGNSTYPQSRNWSGIYFYGNGSSGSVLRRSKIYFAGYSYYFSGGYSGFNGGVTIDMGSPVIDYCEMENNYYGAKLVRAANPQFTNNTIKNSEIVPVAITFDANPDFNNNDFQFSGNTYQGIGLLGGTLFADAVLPIRSSLNVSNLTYILLDNINVPDSLSLTIKKGVVIKTPVANRKFTVEGKMTAVGTADSMIVFTSIKDDNYGEPGDTNFDGTTTYATYADWGGLTFTETADSNSTMAYCRIKFAKHLHTTQSPSNYNMYNYSAISVFKTNMTIKNCEISDVERGISVYNISRMKIKDNSFVNSISVPIAISVSAAPFFEGNSFNNCLEALGIIGERVGFDGSIKQETLAGFENITYLLLNILTVNAGTNITVEPGVVIKFGGNYIHVKGGFKAVGSETEKIVFTSLKDDNYGNPLDTNGDGNLTNPSANDWGGVDFTSTSDNGFCKIDQAVFKFGGQTRYDSKGGSIYCFSSSPQVSNTEIWDSRNFGLCVDGNATPIFRNIKLYNCIENSYPVGVSLMSNADFGAINDVLFEGCSITGLKIIDTKLSSDATIIKKNVAGVVNIPYVLKENLEITSGATLTINSGIIIKNAYYYTTITVKGALVAEGKVDDKIIFTSIKDDSKGGDTNNDGSDSSPEKGDWSSITFTSSGLEEDNFMKNCELRFGSYYSSWTNQKIGVIRFDNSGGVLDSCTIEYGKNCAFGIYGDSDPLIKNCKLNNIDNSIINMSMFASPVFENNSAENIDIMAIGVYPEIYSLNAAIPLRDFVGFENISYYLYKNLTVNSGTEISIPAGAVFKTSTSWNVGFVVNGGLKVEGTALEPVVFTHLFDDDYGNPQDTQEDGSATVPQILSNMKYIQFKDVSNDEDCMVDNTIFRYADFGIDMEQSSPVITNSIFKDGKYGICLNGVSNPDLSNCHFDDLSCTPMLLSLTSYPSLTSNNSLSGSTFKAISVLSETLAQDITLGKKNFCGITNIPYLFSDYTVGLGVTLSFLPGTVVKFHNGRRLVVKSGLEAFGTAEEKVVFTSLFDDFYGGDSNTDSSMTPSPGESGWYSSYYNWDGILFTGEAIDSRCHLENVIVRGTKYYGAISTVNSSPTILNSSISYNQYGFYLEGASNPLINYCDIFNNIDYGVNNVDQSFIVDATHNWWGSDTGPTHVDNPGGTGDLVSDGVDYADFIVQGSQNPVAGDVSLNGLIQAYDAFMILDYSVNSTSLTPIQLAVADVSGNDEVTAFDASLILQYLVGRIDNFPCEEGKAKKGITKTTEYLALQEGAGGEPSIGSATVCAGETFKIPVIIEEAVGVVAVETAIKYPVDILEFTASEFQLEGMNYKIIDDKEKGEIRFAAAGSDILAGNLILVKLEFKAKDILIDDTEVSLTADLFRINETDLTEIVKPALIKVQGIPLSLELKQNYPNPFNPSTTIDFVLPEKGKISLKIYNIKGELVRTLVSSVKAKGFHTVVWNGSDDYDKSLSSGVYYYSLKTDFGNRVQKLMIVK